MGFCFHKSDSINHYKWTTKLKQQVFYIYLHIFFVFLRLWLHELFENIHVSCVEKSKKVEQNRNWLLPEVYVIKAYSTNRIMQQIVDKCSTSSNVRLSLGPRDIVGEWHLILFHARFGILGMIRQLIPFCLIWPF